MSFNFKPHACALAVFAGITNNAMAQTAQTIDSIVITATPLPRSANQLTQPATVLTGDDLERLNAGSLGETLSSLPGVTSSGFAPGAGRPIIRGQDGPRVQMLENSMGVNDVSALSPDHRVATETLNAQQVEVLRGPATLLYGSGAIGGLINVVNRRIPLTVPGALKGEAQMRLGSNAGERTANAELTGGQDGFAWHVDGLSSRAGEYRFPGRAVVNDPDSATGRLFNSYSKSREFGAGGSFTAGDALVGISHQRQTSNYGVPGEEAFLDMRQSRTDALARVKLDGLFESVNVRLARTDYEHSEIELPDRVIASTFKNKSTEGRLELNHAPIGPFKGSLVLQSQRRDFSALTPDGGVELVEPTKTTANALALVEQADFDAFAIDAGIRTESEKHQPSGISANPARKFSLMSASIGGLWRFMPGFNAALTLSSNQRAPTPSELYTNGPHEATATFEVGSPSLAKEKSRAVDLTLRKTDGPVRGSVALFTQRFSNYVYGQFADANGDGVADRVDDGGVFAPDGQFVFLQYTQRKARFRGGEFEIDGDLPIKGLSARLFGDRVIASLDDGTPLPRIAPSRLGAGLSYAAGPWRGGFTATRVAAQNRVSLLETPTAGYTRVDLNAAYRFKIDGATVDLYALLRNATDGNIRLHTSFLKDSAPQPGRTLLAGVRAGF